MIKTQKDGTTPDRAGRVFSAQLHRIRDAHIEAEAILQSLAALQTDNPCARCANVCCKEALCRESIDSDFLRFVLDAKVDDYSASDGWYVPGSGCRLSYGRPLVCYEFFCEQFDTQEISSRRQLSRAFKQVYARAYADQHILTVDDISRISEHKLGIILGRLQSLTGMANEALRHALGKRYAVQAISGQGDRPRPA
jgi:hypothetical protein